MSFGFSTRKGAALPFDEVCACEFERDGLVCVCTRQKEQAKDRCSRCMDGKHRLLPATTVDAV